MGAHIKKGDTKIWTKTRAVQMNGAHAKVQRIRDLNYPAIERRANAVLSIALRTNACEAVLTNKNAQNKEACF